MIGEHGPAEACRQLIRSSTPSTGFTKLWEHEMLDITVEALALLPWTLLRGPHPYGEEQLP